MGKIKNFFTDVFKGGHVVEHKKFWFTFPLIFVFIGLIVFTSFWIAGKSFGKGMNIGIDFTGGNKVNVNMESAEEAQKQENVDKIYEIITRVGGAPASNQIEAETSIAVRYTFDNPDNLADADFQLLQQDKNAEIENLIEAEMAEVGLVDSSGQFAFSQNIGPSASSRLISSAFICLAVALVLIMVYVAFRFKFWSGLSAVTALLHDIIMMLMLTIIFRIQVNANFIAAIITIVAYSINNTIVIFDRVRENEKINTAQGGKATNSEIVNSSVKSTLRRSINTTVTTLFGILLLAIIGAPSIREFALPVIFGLIAGLYSSIVIAPSMYVGITDSLEKRKKGGKIRKNEQPVLPKERKSKQAGGDVSKQG